MSHYTFIGADNTTLCPGLGWTNGSIFSAWVQGNEATGRDQGDILFSPDAMSFAGDGTFGGTVDILSKGANWDLSVGGYNDGTLIFSAAKLHYLTGNKLELRWISGLGVEFVMGSILDGALALGPHTFSYNGAGVFLFDGVPYGASSQTVAGQKFFLQLYPSSAFNAGIVSLDASPGAPPPPPPPPGPPLPPPWAPIDPAPSPFFGGAMGGAGVSGAQGNDAQWAKAVPNLSNHRWKY